MELSLLILVCMHKSYIVYLEIYVVPIGHGFSFLVMEKSWKINVEKRGTLCIAHTCYGDMAGWVSITRWYYIKTAKPILKLFRPSGSTIILVSSDPCTDTQFQGEPLQWGVKYTGRNNWRFSCDFLWKSPFISETVRDRPMVTMER